jgi:hypothetical protein
MSFSVLRVAEDLEKIDAGSSPLNEELHQHFIVLNTVDDDLA